MDEVRDIAFRLAQVVARGSRARRINFDWIEPAREIRIRIDQDQARLLGLSSASIAGVLNTVDDRRDRHPGARRHLSRRRACCAPPTSSAFR